MQRVRSLYHISEGAPVFKAQNIVGRSAKLELAPPKASLDVLWTFV